MHNPESIQENETLKVLLDFEIQTDLLDSARRPDLATVNKKKENLPNNGLCGHDRPQSKMKRKRKEKLKTTMNMKVTVIPIVTGVLETIPKD